jgi:hypothetical protein
LALVVQLWKKERAANWQLATFAWLQIGLSFGGFGRLSVSAFSAFSAFALNAFNLFALDLVNGFATDYFKDFRFTHLLGSCYHIFRMACRGNSAWEIEVADAEHISDFLEARNIGLNDLRNAHRGR